jgi:ribonuclease-3
VSDSDLAARAQEILGHSFRNTDLLVRSLTHASSADSRVQSNERLEFLGDAVLGLVVCDELYRRFSGWLEGDLTKVKSMVVSRRVCAEIADEIGLTQLLILGNGIDPRGGLPVSLRAAVYEAVIGALHLDAGFEIAKEFILKTASDHIDTWSASENRENYKSALQQYAQRWLGATPYYDALDEQGPDHAKCFEVCVVINGDRFPSAWGPSKKDAEQKAACRALEMLQASDTPPAVRSGTQSSQR